MAPYFYKTFLLLTAVFFTHFVFAQTCNDAITNDIYTSPVTRYTIVGNDASNNLGSCAFDGDDAVWVVIAIPSNALATEITITLSDWNGCSATFGCQTNVTGALYSGTCGSLTTIDGCIDLTEGAFNTTNNGPWTYAITPGTNYYFRLSEEDDQGGYADLLFELDTYALPAELTAFAGTDEKDGNLLAWTTASESDVEWFILEKSPDAKTWQEYDWIAAVGNSDAPQDYHLWDKAPFEQSYYRLRIADFDGSTDFSEMILVENYDVVSPVLTVYPNPSTGVFNVRIVGNTERNSQQFFTLTNSLGQTLKVGEISTENLYDNNFGIDLTSFSNGVYFLNVQDSDGNVYTEKLYKGGA